MGKNKILAFVLNFLLPGLGYIYNGKRIKFGLLVLFYHLLLVLFLPLTYFALFLSAIYFAFWAAKEAEKINKLETLGKPYRVEYPEFKGKNLILYLILVILFGIGVNIGTKVWLGTLTASLEKEVEKEMMRKIAEEIGSNIAR